MEQPACGEALKIQIGETEIRFREDYCKVENEQEVNALLRELAGELYPVLQAQSREKN